MLPDGLLAEAKNYLDKTWDDPEGDSKLADILSRGIVYLDKIAGGKLDYTAQDNPQALLFDYARYVRSNSFDQFQANYLHELLTLQINTRVDNNAANSNL